MSTPPPWQDPPAQQQSPPPETPPWGGPPLPPQQPYPYPSQPSSNSALYVIFGAMAILVVGIIAALLIPGSPIAITGNDDDEKKEQPLSQAEAAEQFLRAAFRCDMDYALENTCGSLRSDLEEDDFCEPLSVERLSCEAVDAGYADVECDVTFAEFGDITFELEMQGNDVCEVIN